LDNGCIFEVLNNQLNKTAMKTLTKTLCGMAILLAFACKKEDNLGPKGIGSLGTPGTGTPGAAINAGINGNDGTDGTDGSDGTAVYYSDWYSPGHVASPPAGNGGSPGNPVPNGNPSLPAAFAQSHSFTVTAPRVTQDILDKGVVLAYCRLHNEGTYTRPLATTVLVNNYLHIFNYGLSPGKVHFTQFVDDPMGIPSMDSRNKFRYVVIPPTKSLRLSKPLKDMTYEEVCDLFGIPK
jgi:hypothetical protein